MSLLSTRKPTATDQRIKNMRAIVAKLSTREMMTSDIAALLGYGKSGTRKYSQDLRAAGVMEIARYVDATPTYIGSPIYCITDNPDRIAAFFEMLCLPPKKRIGVGAPSTLTKAQRDPSRHVHILHDDTPVQLRMRRDAPIRHTDLMSAFYPQLLGGAA